MALLKFKAFTKDLKEAKLLKEREKQAEQYKKAYQENLGTYNVEDASQLTDEQLTEFLEKMKTYRSKK